MKRGGIAVLLVAGFLLPRLLGGSALLYDTLVVVAIFGTMAYGLDIILSDLGEISLAHTAFFAAGAYAAALLSVNAGWGAWETLAGAITTALVLAAVLGAITLRTREFAFSLVTYAAAAPVSESTASGPSPRSRKAVFRDGSIRRTRAATRAPGCCTARSSNRSSSNRSSRPFKATTARRSPGASSRYSRRRSMVKASA